MIFADCCLFAIWFSRVRHGHNALPSAQLVLLCCINTMFVYRTALSHAGAVCIQITRSFATLNAVYSSSEASVFHLTCDK